MNVRRRQPGRHVAIEYDPPIGFRLATSGISFKIAPFDDVVEELMADRMFVRDAIVQLLSRHLASVLREEEVPLFQHELILSALLKRVSLDSLIGVDRVNDAIRQLTSDEALLLDVAREQSFYESVPLSTTRISRVATKLAAWQFTEADLKDHVRSVIMHSLAHTILLACAITAGSQLDDMDYLVNDDEIVVFDWASGGNGSSATCFQFLSGPSAFGLEEYLGGEEREELYKPRYFDETFLELLLPCINGVADRVFFYSKVSPSEAELVRRIEELREKEQTHSSAIARVRGYGLTSALPISIGYHAMDYSNSPQDAERFKEISTICVHGCPDCISLGRKCSSGSFQERYLVSKYSLDRLFSSRVASFVTDRAEPAELERLVREAGLAILRVSSDSDADYRPRTSEAMKVVLSLAGRNLDGRYAKFAGHWIDLDFEDRGIVHYYMISVI